MGWGNVEANWTDDEEDVEVEVRPSSVLFYQSGRVEIGGFDGSAESMRVSVEFANQFPEGMMPYIFVQAEGQEDMDYPDVFACTVIGPTVSHAGFECNVGRIGPNRDWGQNLILNWVAMHAETPLIQTYQIEIGSCDGGVVNTYFQHPYGMARGLRPYVFTCPVGDDYPDSFVTTIKRSTSHGVNLGTTRVIDNGWGQNLRMNVMCVSEGAMPTLSLELGNADSWNKVMNGAWGCQLPQKPVALSMICHQSGAAPEWQDTVACCVANVQPHGFQINLGRADVAGAGWGQNLRANIVIFP